MLCLQSEVFSDLLANGSRPTVTLQDNSSDDAVRYLLLYQQTLRSK